MKIKTIPFDLKIAKQIQKGEFKGKIKTRDKRDVRIVCWDMKNPDYPILALICCNDTEVTFKYTNNGRFNNDELPHYLDLFIEISDTKPQFKPFDKVLVRDADFQLWKVDFYSHFKADSEFPHVCISTGYTQCIPFEGNEYLVGTAKKSKED